MNKELSKIIQSLETGLKIQANQYRENNINGRDMNVEASHTFRNYASALLNLYRCQELVYSNVDKETSDEYKKVSESFKKKTSNT